MKSLAMLFAVSVVMGGVGVSAQAAPNPARALRTLQENAREARYNAGIYQWVRVNHEVDRIVASERAVQKALAGDAASAKSLDELRQVVRALRAARLNHDVAGVQEAAQQVADLSAALSK